MWEKGGNRLVPGPDYMVDALKLPNQASRVSAVDSRDLNLKFSHTEATRNKLFLSSPTKNTVEPSWQLVLVWSPFELLYSALTMIILAQYCRMWPISHIQSPSV
ncbi:hypothetical protein TNCV_2973291 [Trichonephila clavipes]|nr:hypothetical protein TNCV_2973291 [Trichonephila clavipes]